MSLNLSRNSLPIPRRDGCCPKSADTAVVIREYGPTTNIPHPIRSAMFPPTQFTPGSSGQSALNSLYPKSYFKITLILSYSNMYIKYITMLDSPHRDTLLYSFLTSGNDARSMIVHTDALAPIRSTASPATMPPIILPISKYVEIWAASSPLTLTPT